MLRECVCDSCHKEEEEEEEEDPANGLLGTGTQGEEEKTVPGEGGRPHSIPKATEIHVLSSSVRTIVDVGDEKKVTTMYCCYALRKIPSSTQTKNA